MTIGRGEARSRTRSAWERTTMRPTGMGGDGGTTDRSPLDMIGPGSDRNAKVAKRQVGEATGKTGRTLPEQYRRGLDEFLNKATRR